MCCFVRCFLYEHGVRDSINPGMLEPRNQGIHESMNPCKGKEKKGKEGLDWAGQDEMERERSEGRTERKKAGVAWGDGPLVGTVDGI